MSKENKWLGRINGAILALGVLAFLLVLAYILVPPMIGGTVPPGASSTSTGSQRSLVGALTSLQHTVETFLGGLVMLTLVVLGPVSLAGMAMSVMEIANAKNEGGWKALWAAITLLLGSIGVLAYWHVGRKGLE